MWSKKKKNHNITGLPWWHGIHLPMQGLTPDLEDPTCPGTSKPRATATEPVLQGPKGSLNSEEPEHHDEEASLLASTGESSGKARETQCSQK